MAGQQILITSEGLESSPRKAKDGVVFFGNTEPQSAQVRQRLKGSTSPPTTTP